MADAIPIQDEVAVTVRPRRSAGGLSLVKDPARRPQPAQPGNAGDSRNHPVKPASRGVTPSISWTQPQVVASDWYRELDSTT